MAAGFTLYPSGLRALFALLGVEAQTTPKVGYLSIGLASDPRRAALLGAFQEGLRDLGYIEGKNLSIEARFDEGYSEQLSTLAIELVLQKVLAIVAYSTPAAQAAKSATKSIPIIMSTVIDPLGTGLVASLGRPGGNVTGLYLMAPRHCR
jgi:putative tryptophan/tyrosine transport system substrate-binding protein